MVWTRCKDLCGYPKALVDGNFNTKVHRLVFELSNPEVPMENKVVRHKCDVRDCINPDHLELGTHLDNIRDRHSRGRTFGQVFDDEVEKVRDLRVFKGLTYQQTADALGIKYKRVEYIVNKFIK